jgi:hypothetical protein
VAADSGHLPGGNGGRPDHRDHRQADRQPIQDVRPNAIVLASDEARTPDGQGAAVTRLMVELAMTAPTAELPDPASLSIICPDDTPGHIRTDEPITGRRVTSMRHLPEAVTDVDAIPPRA